MILNNKKLISYNFFLSQKKKIKSNILIVGSGRWSKVLIKEILKNFQNIKKIFVTTKYKLNLKKWIKEEKLKRIIILDKFLDIKKIKSNYAIVANKTRDHYKFTKKLLLNNFNVIVEKPFVLNLCQINELKKISKKKNLFLLISLQFIYSRYFFFLKKKIRKKILTIDIEWFDKKNEIRHGFKKSYSYGINYFEDIFYHIYSILFFLFGKKKIVFVKKNFRSKKKNILFKFGSFFINIHFSKNFDNRKRTISFKFLDNKVLFINFSNDKNIKISFCGKFLKQHQNISDTSIKYQLFYFLMLKKYKLEILLNDLRKLNGLFSGLKKLRNFL